jgi:hypothetical protein
MTPAMRRAATAAFLHVTVLGCQNSGEESPEPDNAQWHRYQGTYRYYAEQNSELTECGTRVHQGATSGYLGLVPASGADRSTIVWEGLGCRLPVTVDQAGALHASAEPCQLQAGAEIGRFNVIGIVLRDFSFDARGRQFSAAGRIERQIGAERRAYCFELEATVGMSTADAGG